MTALWIVLDIFCLVLLLLLVPVGAEVSYRGALRLSLRLGPLRFGIYPSRGGTSHKAEKNAGRRETNGSGAGGKKSLSPPNRRQIFYMLDTLPPLLCRLLRRVGRRLRLPVLRLHVVFAGEDPADTALLYGRAQAVASALLPLLEQAVSVGKTDIQFSADYGAPHILGDGELQVRIRLGALLALGCGALREAFVWLRGYQALAQPEIQERATDAVSAA